MFRAGATTASWSSVAAHVGGGVDVRQCIARWNSAFCVRRAASDKQDVWTPEEVRSVIQRACSLLMLTNAAVPHYGAGFARAGSVQGKGVLGRHLRCTEAAVYGLSDPDAA